MADNDYTPKGSSKTGQETESTVGVFLRVMEYLSKATGLSIEDMAELLTSREGPLVAMMLTGHLQAAAMSTETSKTESIRHICEE